jgi:hypothetical protein
MHEERVHDIVVVDAAELESVQEIAAAHGVEVQEVPRRGFEPITTVTVIVIGTAFAIGAVTAELERQKGGQVIDLRRGAPRQFYRDKGVVFGYVILLREDGTVTVDVKEPKQFFGTVVEAVTKLAAELVKAPLDVLADAVAQVVGDHGTVSAEREPEPKPPDGPDT